MSEQPRVSVLMPAFNNEAFLPEAIASVLAQTFADFEFIIIDDGSTDGSWDVMNSYHDPRIHPMRNDRNLGLTRSLNKGLDQANGTYIARQDADDISAPERLEKQIALLENSPEIGLVGSHCITINREGREGSLFRKPLSDLEIRWTILLDNPFIHPSVMIRKKVLEQHHLRYDERFQTSQDYELWTRVLSVTQGANYDGVLLKYRLGHERVTATKRQAQLRNHDLIAYRTIREQLPEFPISEEQTGLLRALFVSGDVESSDPPPGPPRTEGMRHVLRSPAAMEKRPTDRRVEWVALYFEMLKAFASRYEREAGIKTLQGREALKMIRRLPLRPEALHLLVRILFASPGLPGAMWEARGRIFSRLIRRSHG